MEKTQITTQELGTTGLEITRVGFGAVGGAIVSFRRPDQVDPILVAASLQLTDEDIDEIEGRNS